MKSIPKTCKLIFTVIIISITLNSCAALGLAETEFIAVRALTLEAGVEDAFVFNTVERTIIFSAENDAIVSALRRVRMEPPISGKAARLYVPNRGGVRYFGEVVNENTLRITEQGIDKEITLPEGMRMFRVKNSKVSVYSSPKAATYNLYKMQLNRNDIVLVLEQVNKNWYQVQIDKGIIGYVSALALASVSNENSNSSSSTPTLAKKDNNDCEKLNTGDYCFYNATPINVIVKVGYNIPSGAYIGYQNSKIILTPSQSKCVYGVSASGIQMRPNHFVVTNEKDNALDEGDFIVEQCKTGSYTITSTKEMGY